MFELIIGAIFLLLGFCSLFIKHDWICKKINQYEGIFLLIVFMVLVIGFLFLIDGIGIILER